MGYYSGNGVVTGGGDTIALLDTVISGGTLIRSRKTTRETLVKNGVSEATAKAATSSASVRCGDLTCGSFYWATPQAAGLIVNYSYSRISDSNLFQLVQETEKFQTRLSARSGAGVLDNGSWAALP